MSKIRYYARPPVCSCISSHDRSVILTVRIPRSTNLKKKAGPFVVRMIHDENAK